MALVRLDITNRELFADGESFGDAGPYRLLEGDAHFAVAPLHPRNEAITDLELAPRDDDGNVRFSAHFAMLQPADPERGNRRILFDVLNRGRKTVLSGLNSSDRGIDPNAPVEPGNGFLMRHGYTVVWCGWQADVPPTPGLMGLQAPGALGSSGNPIEGRIMCWLQANQPTQVFLLADRTHLPHPPVDVNDPDATLAVREHPNGPATPISRDEWSFVRVEDAQVEPEPSHVYMHSGFKPGKIYELVYRTRGSAIVGLGFAAVRDSVSFLKYAPAEAGNPSAAGIDRAYALGISQSGRFLRQMIHLGLNEDEEERTALDGIIPHVAGGMRGEFNMRFGQPSKDICFVIPELFPFTDTEQTDPVTGESGSLLGRMNERGNAPKIMFCNTSAEYWRGDAALIHTNIEEMTDAEEASDTVRRYHFAGTQHGSGDVPTPGGAAGGRRAGTAPVQQRRLLPAAPGRAGEPGPVGHRRHARPRKQTPQPRGGHGSRNARICCPASSRCRACPCPTSRRARCGWTTAPNSTWGARRRCRRSRARSTPRWFRTWTNRSTKWLASGCRT